jgi:hypothetical protein
MRKKTFFLMLFVRGNSQIIDTAEGNLSVGQFLGIDTDSGRTSVDSAEPV